MTSKQVESPCNATLECLEGCPPGLYCMEGQCECGVYPDDIIRCNGTRSLILNCNCATFDEERNSTLVGACMFNCGRNLAHQYTTNLLLKPLPRYTKELNSMTCKSMNRNGTLCGRCLPGYHPSAYSFNLTCIRCPHVGWDWFRYIMAAYLPLTLFYVIVLFFKINTTSSYLSSIVIYCQAISLPSMIRSSLLTITNNASSSFVLACKVLFSLYGIWSLDFFRLFYSDICLGIGVLPTLALDYVIAIYPLFLMIVSYLLIVLYERNYRVITIPWRPFRVLFSLFRRHWDVRTSVIDAYATFFLLSNIKFLSVSFDLLVPTRVYELHQDHYNYSLGLYYAADIEYFGSEHLPYAILAIVVLMTFVILPIIILTIYQFSFFQWILNQFPCRWHMLRTFVRSFQDCYKDGSEPGWCDCRYFSSIHFLLRLFLITVYGLFILNVVFFAVGASALMLFAALIMIVQPFKSVGVHNNTSNAVFIQLLSLCFTCISGVSLSSLYMYQIHYFLYMLTFTIVSIPLLFTIIMTSYWIIRNRKFGFTLIHRISAWRNGYGMLVDSSEEEKLPDRIENSNNYPKQNLARFASPQ